MEKGRQSIAGVKLKSFFNGSSSKREMARGVTVHLLKGGQSLLGPERIVTKRVRRPK